MKDDNQKTVEIDPDDPIERHWAEHAPATLEECKTHSAEWAAREKVLQAEAQKIEQFLKDNPTIEQADAAIIELRHTFTAGEFEALQKRAAQEAAEQYSKNIASKAHLTATTDMKTQQYYFDTAIMKAAQEQKERYFKRTDELISTVEGYGIPEFTQLILDTIEILPAFTVNEFLEALTDEITERGNKGISEITQVIEETLRETQEQKEAWNHFREMQKEADGNLILGPVSPVKHPDQLALEGFVIDDPPEHSALDALELLQGKPPDFYPQLMNKLTGLIPQISSKKGSTQIDVAGRSAKKQVITRVSFDKLINDKRVKGAAKLTPYDQIVQGGVIALYKNGATTFTPAQVWRAMNLKDDNATASPEAIRDVSESLDRQSITGIEIDFTDEAARYKGSPVNTKYSGFILYLEKVTVKAGAHKVEAYKILREPILYTYANMTKQIELQQPIIYQLGGYSLTTQRRIIIEHLQRRLHDMESNSYDKRGGNYKITYDSIYNQLDISQEKTSPANYKKRTFEARESTKIILSVWTANGTINNYTEYKEGKSLKGIIIKLVNPQNL